jgi:hydrogenase maturation protein HypF
LKSDKSLEHIQRLKIVIQGVVQGVGFRPFIYRLATNLGLKGWVQNTSAGVFIEVEGEKNTLDTFLLSITKEKPPQAIIQSLEYSFLDPVGYQEFKISESNPQGIKSVLILPDIATCIECINDIFDKNNRRYLYPFTNCTNCGPRFTIIEKLPYDRPNTSMKKFPMCQECKEEYDDPANRRFHAQPIACHRCGPVLELWDNRANKIAKHYDAILKAAQAIKEGKIVALKGLGGFQLIVDAQNDEAVKKLRIKKHREEKPFALMYPHLELIKQHCEVSPLEEQILTSPQAPIVLLKCKSQNLQQYPISPLVAPNNPYLGIMLPYTPLHHLLMKEVGFPIVATSGNISDEPICIDEYEALKN